MTTRIAQLFILIPCGIAVLAACGERTSQHEHDLLTAKCTLVERMTQWHGFLGDEMFELGVRCDGPPSAYFEILSTGSSEAYGIARDPSGRAGAITVFACRDAGPGGRQGVDQRVAALNDMSERTGLTFTMSPVRTNCPNHFPRDGSMLTDWNNKNFERLLDGG